MVLRWCPWRQNGSQVVPESGKVCGAMFPCFWAAPSSETGEKVNVTNVGLPPKVSR